LLNDHDRVKAFLLRAEQLDARGWLLIEDVGRFLGLNVVESWQTADELINEGWITPCISADGPLPFVRLTNAGRLACASIRRKCWPIRLQDILADRKVVPLPAQVVDFAVPAVQNCSEWS
jgi:hypothetical protein